MLSWSQKHRSPSFSENLPDLVIPVDGLGAHDQHHHVVLGPPPLCVPDQIRLPPPLRHLRLVQLRRK